MPRVIVVEDDARTRASLVAELRDEGLEVVAFADVESASPALRDGQRTDLLLLDVRLPGRSGVDLVRDLAARGGLPPTIVTSGEATISETVEALRLGVYDFIEKPFSRERLRTSIRNALGRAALEGEVASLRSAIGEAELIGGSPAMQTLRETIASAARTEVTVLIRGESGTGKELVAAMIHRASLRPQGAFIKVNCAAIAPHSSRMSCSAMCVGRSRTRGARSPGYSRPRTAARCCSTRSGTWIPGLQARLLRVLEDGKVRRLGDSREIAVDVRVLAATHQDLEAAVRERRFREDLYFRLARLVIDVPPLRERTGDVPRLAAHFVEVACRQQRTRPKGLEPEALARLEAPRLAGQRPGAEERLRAGRCSRRRPDHCRRSRAS